MLGEIFQKVFDIIIGWINDIFDFILSPVTNAIDQIALQVPAISGYKDFLSACVETFVPYRYVLIALALMAPVYVMNLTVSIINAIKSYIPGFSGN